MEEPIKPSRRWFRFSLRTLLVLVTLVCIYLGWAMNWKKQREAFMESLASRIYTNYAPPAPIWIRIVGAEGCAFLAISETDESQRLKAKRLFPEAEIISPILPPATRD